MGFQLKKSDLKELKDFFPSLNCEIEKQIVWSTLSFYCSYDLKNSELIHNSSDPDSISDSYEVLIDFNNEDQFGFPKVYEPSNRIKNYARIYHIKLEDLHINQDDESCCLGIFPEYQWISVSQFIFDKVVPFFYWQSHLRIYEQEPWHAYSHGDDGIIEALRFPVYEVSKAHNRNKLCPCNSGLKYKKCCLSRDKLLLKVLKDQSRTYKG